MATDSSAGAPADWTEALSARFVEFVAALRSKGITAGTSETIDAARAAGVLGFADRTILREGLAAALLRREGQRDVFDLTFDLFFPSTLGRPQSAQNEASRNDAPDPSKADLQDLRDLLAMALADGDLRNLNDLAEISVDALGQVGSPGSDSAGWSAFQTLDSLQPRTAISPALRLRASATTTTVLPADLERDEIRGLIDTFTDAVASEARRRTAEVRGRDRVSKYAIPVTSQRIDFLSANREQLAELNRTVRPLARRLATRLAARRRRAGRGRIDVRRTMRRAMGTGGVPLDPVFERPACSKPELVLLCDVSGSVAGFSNFTMLLVRALGEQFTRVRVFAFINATAEVTELVREADDPASAITEQTRVSAWHNSSDYGTALGDFVRDHLDAVGSSTSVLILGDARNNNLAENSEALDRIVMKAKRAYWLNPEPMSRWNLGDSVAQRYGTSLPMIECSSVEQLSRFVARLLPV